MGLCNFPSPGSFSAQFVRAYDYNIAMQSMEALDASPLAQAIFRFSGKYPSFYGTAVRLVEELQSFIRAGDEKYFPNTPRQLGRKLTEITPALISLGYSVERSRGEERFIRIAAPSKTETNDDNVKTSHTSSYSRHCDVRVVKFQAEEGTTEHPSFEDFGGGSL